MKKTSKTLLTAAVLTAAALNQGPVNDNGNKINASPLYGPPWVLYDQGDVNMDGKVNVLDDCLMRSIALGSKRYYEESLTDINRDGKIDSKDVLAVQKFLQAINKDVTCIDDITTEMTTTQTPMQTKYGTFPTTITTPQSQPAYGTFPCTELTTPPKETSETLEDKFTTTTQPKYGPFSAVNDEQEGEVTAPPESDPD